MAIYRPIPMPTLYKPFTNMKNDKKIETFIPEAYKALPSETLWTIGYGHLIADGTKSININGALYTTLIVELATILLMQNLNNTFVPKLNSFLKSNDIILNQHQYDACILDCFQKGQNIWANQVQAIAKFILAKQHFNDYNKVLAAFLGSTTTGGVNISTNKRS